MPDKTLLVTSLNMRDIDHQQQAVASWLRLGFSVVSLNVQADIEALRPHFENVEFVAVADAASGGQHEPSIAFAEAVDYLKAHGTSVCGIIRPDIRLRATPDAVRFLLEEARDSLLYASRTDVDGAEAETGEIHKSGFDVFLFDRKMLASLPAVGLCLNRAWWDLWLPYSLMRPPQGHVLKFAAFPFAFHHARTARDEEAAEYRQDGLTFAEFLDRGAHAALQVQPAELLGRSLEAMRLNVAMSILFESRWITRFPETPERL